MMEVLGIFSRREMAELLEHENAESHTVTDAIRLDVRTSS